MSIEIERKWLVKEFPSGINIPLTERIVQAYVLDKEGVVLRVRTSVEYRKGGIYDYRGFITVKGSTEIASANREFEMNIPHDMADTLVGACEQRITKLRHKIPYGLSTIELDEFQGKLGGLLVAEVEFENAIDCHNFCPPHWFGKEVTGNRQYANSNLIKLQQPPKEI